MIKTPEGPDWLQAATVPKGGYFRYAIYRPQARLAGGKHPRDVMSRYS